MKLLPRRHAWKRVGTFSRCAECGVMRTSGKQYRMPGATWSPIRPRCIATRTVVTAQHVDLVPDAKGRLHRRIGAVCKTREVPA